MIDCRENIMHLVDGVNQIKYQYDNDPENSIHYVLWSGGCDSSLLLYELLDAYGCNRVVAVSYKYPWLDKEKYETERLHREAFKAKLKLRGEKFANINHTEFNISTKTVSGNNIDTAPGGTPQAIAWILSIPLYAPSGYTIYTGAIKGDDLPLFIHEYSEIFSNIAKVLKRDINLRTPYLYLNKSQIIQKLIEYDLYEETWFCEEPKDVNKPCYKCTPCSTHISALCSLELMTTNDFIRSRCQKELAKIRKITNKENSKIKE